MIEEVAQEIRGAPPAYGLLAGRGSSDNAARYAQYVFGVRNRLVCGLATPSVTTVYDSPPDMKASLTIGLSQSGQSPDIVRVVEVAAHQGAMTLAITNDPDSPLARAAGRVIQLRAGDESAVPATKTYTAELMVVAMLSAALQQSAEAWTTLQGLPQAVQDVIDMNADLVGIQDLRSSESLLSIGRGFNYATAFETALKISETGSVPVLAFSSADFFHGPIASLGAKTPVLLIAPSGKLDAQVPKLLTAIEDRAVPFLAISDDETLLQRATMAVRLPPVPEWVSPITAAVAGQLLAAVVAKARRADPDGAGGLSKVTRTY